MKLCWSVLFKHLEKHKSEFFCILTVVSKVLAVQRVRILSEQKSYRHIVTIKSFKRCVEQLLKLAVIPYFILADGFNMKWGRVYKVKIVRKVSYCSKR